MDSDPERSRPVTVPVIADSLPRTNSTLDLARCVYFSITADSPATPFRLTLPDGEVDFLMLGLQGIILRPSQGNEDEFVAPSLLGDLIEAIEQNEEFSVGTEYLWIPTVMLDRARRLAEAGVEAEKGDVFRVDRHFFAEAWRAAQGGVSFDDFAKEAPDGVMGDRAGVVVSFSPLETKAIKQWSEDQVRVHAEFRR